MADDVVNIQVKINSETGQLEIVNQKLRDSTGAAEKAEKSFLGLTGTAANLAKAYLSIASARQFITFISDSVAEAEKENEALRRLKFSLDSLGQSYDKSSNNINSWAKSIQESTRFSDTEALETLERLVRSTGNLNQAQAASILAMDLSVASGKSLSETTELLNGLIIGNERAVLQARKEFGAFIGTATTTQGVLDDLAEKFKGVAAAEDSVTKSTDQLKNSFSDLKEGFGRWMAPVFDFWSEKLTRLLRQMNDFYFPQNLPPPPPPGGPEQEKSEEQRIISRKIKADEEVRIEQQKLQQMDAHVKEYYKQREAFENAYRKRQDAQMMESLRVYEQAVKKTTEFTKNLTEEAGNVMVQEFSRAITDTIIEGKRFEDAMNNVFKHVISMIMQAIIQMIIFKTIASATGGMAGGFLGWGAPSGAPSGAPGMGSSGILGANGMPIGLQGTAAFGAPSPINVSVSTNSLDLSSADFILGALGKQIAAQTSNAIKFSRLVGQLSGQNNNLAV